MNDILLSCVPWSHIVYHCLLYFIPHETKNENFQTTVSPPLTLANGQTFPFLTPRMLLPPHGLTTLGANMSFTGTTSPPTPLEATATARLSRLAVSRLLSARLGSQRRISSVVCSSSRSSIILRIWLPCSRRIKR